MRYAKVFGGEKSWEFIIVKDSNTVTQNNEISEIVIPDYF